MSTFSLVLGFVKNIFLVCQGYGLVTKTNILLHMDVICKVVSLLVFSIELNFSIEKIEL